VVNGQGKRRIEAGRALEMVWTMLEFSPNSSDIQPMALLYTDWAIYESRKSSYELVVGIKYYIIAEKSE
jgi:hypothetical protein